MPLYEVLLLAKTGESVHSQNFLIKRVSRISFAQYRLSIGKIQDHKDKTYRYLYSLSDEFIFKGKEKYYSEYDKGELAATWESDLDNVNSYLKIMIDEL